MFGFIIVLFNENVRMETETLGLYRNLLSKGFLSKFFIHRSEP